MFRERERGIVQVQEDSLLFPPVDTTRQVYGCLTIGYGQLHPKLLDGKLNADLSLYSIKSHIDKANNIQPTLNTLTKGQHPNIHHK